MPSKAVPLVVRSAGIVIACVLLVQLLNLAVFAIWPPVPLGPVNFETMQQALAKGGYVRGVEVRDIPAHDVPVQDPLLAPIRDVMAARLGLPEDHLRVQFVSMLQALKGTAYAARRIADGGDDPGIREMATMDFSGGITLARLLEDGSWRVANPSGSLFRSRVALATIWLLGTILFAIPCAWLVARWLARPIRQFAEAAERLGRNPREPDLEPDGPRELRGAALAFNEMKGRLGRYVDDRLNMMSAIAHDLRIPLTRLTFRLERVPEPIRSRAEADIAEMQGMLAAVLSFVQATHAQRPRQPQELRSLLSSIADDMAETGRNVSLEEGPDVVLHADDIGLRSLFTNLIDNAVTYGGAARVRLTREDGAAVVEIEDNGPGLPPEELERVFEPFYRTEKSRNRATGGIGLGLALVRSVAVAHGGSASLENRAARGLRARVVLPA
ncbi:sensor histidine kinase [Roseomonas sp. F4]